MAIPRNRAQQPVNRKRTFGECDTAVCQQIIGFLVTAFNSCKDKIPYLERDFTKPSMILPLQFNNDVIPYVYEPIMLDVLENNFVINWSRIIRSLLPMYAEDDGNSLAHSVSLYIFGIQDKGHHLRQLTYQMMFMQKPKEGEIYNRWIADREVVLSKLSQINAQSYDEESKRDWDFYLAKAQQRRDPVTQKFASLDAIHIFTLCNIIGRPIIVYAEVTGNDVIDGIRYEGIYLPILRPPKSCEKSPVLVGFSRGRFVPLFSTENQELNVFQNRPSDQSQHCAPLLRKDLTEIPIRFKQKNEPAQNLLQTYFDIILIPSNLSPQYNITAAMLKFKAPNAQCIELLWSMLDVVLEYVNEDKLKGISQHERNKRQIADQHLIDIPNQFQSISFQSNGQAQKSAYPEAQKPCARQKAGFCKMMAFASKNNDQAMCDSCYQEFLNVRQNVKRRNKVPQSMPVENQQAPPSLKYQHQQNYMSNVPSGGDVCNKCNNNQSFKELGNLCRECFTDEIILKRQQEQQQQEYQPQLQPQPNILPKRNCSHCGKKYYKDNDFALCESCYDNIKRRQEEVEQHKQIGGPQPVAAAQGGYPNVGVADNYSSPVSKGGMSGGEISGFNINSGYQEYDLGFGRRNIGLDTPRGRGGNSYPPAPLVGAAVSGNAQENAAEKEKVRRKTLCSVAGCNNPIRSFNERECAQHFKEKDEHKQCWVCEKNPADDNVHGVCVYCMATQGNLIREHDQGKKGNVSYPPQQNLNIARGPLNMPEQPLPPAQPMDIGIDLESLPDPPQMQPERAGQFNPPTLYEGYGRDKPKQTYGGQQGQLRWQQERINEHKACRSCPEKATRNSLCNTCYARNTVGQHAQPVGVKCGNPDKPSCKNFVLNSDQDFMCQECIQEQRAGMEKVFQKEPVQNQQPLPYGNQGRPCITKNCPNKPERESEDLCKPCKQGQFPNHPYGGQAQPGLYPRPQESQEPINCKAFDCNYNASPEYGGYCHNCFMMVSKHQAEKDQGILQQQQQQQQQQQHFGGNAQQQQPMFNIPEQQGIKYVSVPCRNPDCNMFGRPEQNGLCSRCFKLNKTERD